MTFSQTAFSAAIHAHAPSRLTPIDTNPATRSFVAKFTGTTPEDINDILIHRLPRGSDVTLRLLEDQRRLEIKLACPDETNRRNIAEAQCVYVPHEKALKFYKIETSKAARGTGLGSRIIDNTIDLADELGASVFQMTAGLSHGPAFWAGLKIRPNGEQFDSTFKDPLKERINAIQPYVAPADHQALQQTLAMPYTILPEKLLALRADMRGMADPTFKPSIDLLGAFRAILPEDAPKRPLPQIFSEKVAGLKRRDGSVPLCHLMMTRLSYDAELDLNDMAAVRAVRQALKTRSSKPVSESAYGLPSP